MKRSTRRLALSRETLRHVSGGVVTVIDTTYCLNTAKCILVKPSIDDTNCTNHATVSAIQSVCPCDSQIFTCKC